MDYDYLSHGASLTVAFIGARTTHFPFLSQNVKFVGLCEARGIPVLRIGVTDNSGHLEIQDVASWNLADLGAAHKGTLAELFG